MDIQETFAKLRSEKCQIQSYAIFYNTTNRHVNIIWINYKGEKVLYKLLEPKQLFLVDTFVTHPWICIDIHSGYFLNLNNCPVFYPSHPVHDRRENTKKSLVYITLPVYSLKDIVQQKILLYVTSSEDINRLELPNDLIEDLNKRIFIRRTYNC